MGINDFDIVISSTSPRNDISQLINNMADQKDIKMYGYLVGGNANKEISQRFLDTFPGSGALVQDSSLELAELRKRAFYQGKSPYVAFFHDNIRLKDEKWLKKAAVFFNKFAETAQLASKIYLSNSTKNLYNCGFWGTFPFNQRYQGLNPKSVPNDLANMQTLVPSACMAATVVRRSALQDSNTQNLFLKDLDLSFYLHLTGYDVVYLPELVAYLQTSQHADPLAELQRHYENAILTLMRYFPFDYVNQCIEKIKSETLPENNFVDERGEHKKAMYQALETLAPELESLGEENIQQEDNRVRKAHYLIKMDLDLNDSPSPYGLLPLKNLILSITNRCNANCPMCFRTHELNTKTNELTVDEIHKLLDPLPNLKSVIITGGEPLLRKDILDICRIFLNRSRPLPMTITHNGSFPERISNIVEQLFKEGAPRISVSLSLDGDERFHDENRGIKGLFKKVNECYHRLSMIKEEYPDQLFIQILASFSKENLHYFDYLATYTAKNMPMATFAYEPIRGHDKSKADGLSKDDWEWLLNKSKSYGIKYRRLEEIMELAIFGENKKHFPIPTPCRGGDEFLVLNANGEIAPCELMGPRINVRDLNLELSRLLYNPEWQNAMAHIKSGLCYCTHFCWLSHANERHKKVLERMSFS